MDADIKAEFNKLNLGISEIKKEVAGLKDGFRRLASDVARLEVKQNKVDMYGLGAANPYEHLEAVKPFNDNSSVDGEGYVYLD